jgi:hypothetical protein
MTNHNGSSSAKRRPPSKAFRTAWQDAVRSCPPPEKGVTDYRLTTVERTVAFVMSTYGDIDGRNVFPSLDSIARGAAIHRVSAVRARDRLRSAGWIEMEHQGGAQPGLPRDTSRYRLVLPDIPRGSTGLPVAEDYRSHTATTGVAQGYMRGSPGLPNKENPYKETDKGQRADPSCDECKGKGFMLPLDSDAIVDCFCLRPVLEVVQ